jgi:hypothetical protein
MDRTLDESMPNAPHFATTDSVEDAGTVRLAGESACPTGADVGQALCFRLPTPTFRTAGQQAHGNSVPYLQSGNGVRSMPGIIRSAFL